MTQQWSLLVIASLLGGCIMTPGGTVVDSAMVVHTAGSSKSTISARVPVEAGAVYSAFAEVIDEEPGIELLSRNDAAMLMEGYGDFGEIAAQVTQLGSTESLLYVWVDTKETRQAGSELANRAVQRICEELGVGYEIVRY
jgi:hypothetical protein